MSFLEKHHGFHLSDKCKKKSLIDIIKYGFVDNVNLIASEDVMENNIIINQLKTIILGDSNDD